MNIKKELGKITSVKVGIGGYQDACFGIYFTLEGKGWGVCAEKCVWSPSIIDGAGKTWTEESRDTNLAIICRYIDKMLYDAKVKSVDELKGIPIEATFVGNDLSNWRILVEVL